MHLIVNSKCYITRYRRNLLSLFFFFNDTATTEIYTLSLHDALPICRARRSRLQRWRRRRHGRRRQRDTGRPRSPDRKSTRLNSSHLVISYAVFCLKKKKKLSYPLNLIRHLPDTVLTKDHPHLGEQRA